MSRRNAPETISIRPGVRVLSVLRHLNYRPWYALAEFVDNSLQSYLTNKTALQKIDGRQFQLKVAININGDDGGLITIRDNAAGIGKQDFPRAFRPAEVPLDATGLSEFGMGMKSAACWFSSDWTVRTKALGEQDEKTVHFEINRIIRDSWEELEVHRRPSSINKHFTEITLRSLHHRAPHGRTLGKIREHLAGIYRVFTRTGALHLTLNGEELTYEAPTILKASYYKTPTAKPTSWKKEIVLSLGSGRSVRGFAALREVGSISQAGFALFRRNRLIQGSGDETYRPEVIFGQANSYAYQRLFGELHLDGFEVSHTKDGFQWGELEDTFLSKLKQQLVAKPLPLLDQAQGYRASPSRQIKKRDLEAIADRTANSIRDRAAATIAHLSSRSPVEDPPAALPKKSALAERIFTINHNGQPWEIKLELSNDPSVGPWVELADRPHTVRRSKTDTVRQLHIRFSLEHPFTRAFIGATNDNLEAQLRIAAALALSEVVAREAGVKQAGTLLRNVNTLLRDSLSRV